MISTTLNARCPTRSMGQATYLTTLTWLMQTLSSSNVVSNGSVTNQFLNLRGLKMNFCRGEEASPNKSSILVIKVYIKSYWENQMVLNLFIWVENQK